MYTGKISAIRSRVLVTTLVTMGWLSLSLCWMAFTWSQYSLLQNVVSLGISALLFVAVVGVIWVGDVGFAPAATNLATMGCLSFALYWIGFAWSRYSLLQNGAALMISFLVWLGLVLVFWLAGPAGEYS
jgi:hypothetical protein